MTVIITGVEQIHQAHERLMDKKNYIKPLEKIVEDTKKEIKRNAPRKTGALEENIFSTISGKKFSIVVAVPYAKYMEYGTIHFPVPDDIDSPMARTSTSGKACYHPFIRPSVWKIMNQAKKERIFFNALFKKV